MRAGTLLKKRSLCPGASVFRTCVVWCRVYRIRADRRVTVGVLYLDLELLVEGRAVVVNGSGSVGALIGRFPFDDGLVRAGYQ